MNITEAKDVLTVMHALGEIRRTRRDTDPAAIAAAAEALHYRANQALQLATLPDDLVRIHDGAHALGLRAMRARDRSYPESSPL